MAGREVRSVHTHTSAALLTKRHRIMGVTFTHGTGVSGNIILYDNATAASGPVVLEIDETAQGTEDIHIPGDGILAKNGLYASLPANTSVTVFYM